MTSFIDSSALVQHYVEEPDSEFANSLMIRDKVIATSWLTVVEIRRMLSRLFSGNDLLRARQAAHDDFDAMALIQPDVQTWWAAAEIADSLGVRSLDALQLAAAQRLRASNLTFITFDLRQANAARTLGFHVVGC